MVTFHVYFKNEKGHELRLEFSAAGAETAIEIAKKHAEEYFKGFKFDGRVTRLYKSWV